MIKMTPALAGDQKELYEFNELSPELQEVAISSYRQRLIDSIYVIDKEEMALQLKDDKEVKRMIEEYEPLFTEYGTTTDYDMDRVREGMDNYDEVQVMVSWYAECRVKVDAELAELTEEEFNCAFPAASIEYSAFKFYVDNAEYLDLADLEEDYIVRDYIKSGENLMEFFKDEEGINTFHVDTDFYFECDVEKEYEIQWDELDTSIQEDFLKEIENGNFGGNFYTYETIEVMPKEKTLDAIIKDTENRANKNITIKEFITKDKDEPVK